ncbi:tRNA (adenine(37)-N6)-methyltransferase-like [Sitophilus oryzae]|uniref:tRNA (Adenine(37)-N6)-methyltransferase-like n=1 Tax=Sitophilus oryzae TaxID=7048 RepID=A0A6J2X5V4_SITOR|nr:tRNA (adenine(37)-N6)-methyltransferase-like [Sitophilus oryzae]
MDNTKVTQLQNQLEVARREIHNLRQQLSSLSHLHQKEIRNINLALEKWQCSDCKNRTEQASFSNTAASSVSEDFTFKPIGTISTHFPEKRGTPRQPGICKDTVAKLTLNKDVFTNPYHALEGLQEFSHMWILFYFHKNDVTHIRAKVAPPRLNGIRTGVFATRSPHRPCAIGLSLVKIDRIMDNIIYFSGVDMVDMTPVFDIKPYIPQYDNPGLSTHLDSRLNDVGNNDVSDSNTGLRNNPLTEQIHIDIPQSPNQGHESELVVNAPSLSAREMDGQENGRETQSLETPGSNESRTVNTFYRDNSRIGEREAPDGEEEESPPGAPQRTAVSTAPSTSSGHVRVPSWIDQAPISRLDVSFKDRATAQLQELGTEGEEKRKIITNVLQEDPRSVYLRERWGGHCYVFRIAELYVSCKFNDTTHSVIVYQIFQNERQAEGDE